MEVCVCGHLHNIVLYMRSIINDIILYKDTVIIISYLTNTHEQTREWLSSDQHLNTTTGVLVFSMWDWCIFMFFIHQISISKYQKESHRVEHANLSLDLWVKTTSMEPHGAAWSRGSQTMVRRSETQTCFLRFFL